MEDSVMSILLAALKACLSWFSDLLSVTSFVDLFLGVLFVYTVYRFLLAPLLDGGIRGSDKAKKSKDNKE